MMRISPPAFLAAGLLAASVLFATDHPAQAQSGRQDFFVPAPAPAPARPARPPARPPAAVPAAPSVDDQAAELDDGAIGVVPMPPVPELPALPKGESPPVASIGVIGLPEVMRASLAAQHADRIISERREKLNEDAQKEQLAWREMQQALARDRSKLTANQIREKERELQERITTAQRTFRDRNRIIQEAAQYAINQVQASLIAVIRQVADSRGMNIVLHRNQVALNVNEFDISEKVAEELNRILPTVTVPPDGVSPAIPPTPAAAPAPAAPAPPAKR